MKSPFSLPLLKVFGPKPGFKLIKGSETWYAVPMAKQSLWDRILYDLLKYWVW